MVVDDLALGSPASPPLPAPEPVRFVLGGRISEPVRIRGEDPGYSEAAKKGSVQGAVVLELEIGSDGSVQDVTILRGLPFGLTEAAVLAVNGWQFTPAQLDGNPIAVRYVVTVQFVLGQEAAPATGTVGESAGQQTALEPAPGPAPEPLRESGPSAEPPPRASDRTIVLLQTGLLVLLLLVLLLMLIRRCRLSLQVLDDGLAAERLRQYPGRR